MDENACIAYSLIVLHDTEGNNTLCKKERSSKGRRCKPYHSSSKYKRYVPLLPQNEGSRQSPTTTSRRSERPVTMASPSSATSMANPSTAASMERSLGGGVTPAMFRGVKSLTMLREAQMCFSRLRSDSNTQMVFATQPISPYESHNLVKHLEAHGQIPDLCRDLERGRVRNHGINIKDKEMEISNHYVVSDSTLMLRSERNQSGNLGPEICFKAAKPNTHVKIIPGGKIRGPHRRH